MTTGLRQPLSICLMVDQTLAKYLNELRIFTQLRTHGPTSRADLARRLSLTPATISKLIADLVQRDLVRAVRETANGEASREPGRPSVKVALHPGGAYFLGVEIGVGIIRIALIDLAVSVMDSTEIGVSPSISPRETVKRIARHVAKLARQEHFRGKLHSIGVTVPGLVTSEGFVVNLPILGWKAVDLLALLRKAVKLPCFVENNSNAAAFGSVYTQPNLPSEAIIFLKLGTGCGGAAIVNGRLLRGARGTASEMGHLRVTEHGHRCHCGQIGCLETWVNLWALARAFRGTDALGERELATLPAVVVEAAKRNDPAARKALASFEHYLTLGIASLVNLFNPATVILGGVMRPVLEHCLGSIRAKVSAAVIPGIEVPSIQLSALGDFECAIGAATIAHHHAFDLSNFELREQRLIRVRGNSPAKASRI